MDLTPRKIVEELDRYIVGQKNAKRAVAIAIRNRYRRRMLKEEMRDEVTPKNILMIGPTGVGKTEIARRLAKLTDAPFIKIEATKFTEVGYVGRDVDSIIRDLVDTGIRMVRSEKMAQVESRAARIAEERLLDLLVPSRSGDKDATNPLGFLIGALNRSEAVKQNPEPPNPETDNERQRMRELLAAGALEDRIVEVEVEESNPQMFEVFTGAGIEEMGINVQDLFGGLMPRRRKKRKVSVAEARKILVQEEASRLIDMEEVTREAIAKVEDSGIVFLDEIDKIAGREGGHGPDVSREGVQRDILPIVEGATVMTKYGPVKTDHILFIAAGAFHISKPGDLIPELQGRFPIRVELESLTAEDFERILTEPDNALVKQYIALMATEGVTLEFTEDAILEVAKIAYQVNESTENIGARRLYTVMEQLLEQLSFEAPEKDGSKITVDVQFVHDRLDPLLKKDDLKKYIL
ncbi:MAG: ATP-dependent protease ATPase subunit HslU [Bacillota bacterium]